MKLLVTGGCGFLGSNLSAEGNRRGYQVTVADNLSRVGAAENLQRLQNEHNVSFVHLDTRNFVDVDRLIKTEKPNFILHLAGQVAMTTSLEDPRRDFEVNALGGHNLLEAVRRHSPDTHIFYSSTNKVYGDLAEVRLLEERTRYSAADFPFGFDESIKLDFQSPYGCSKGAIDQYMLDYHRIYAVKTTVFRHSSVFGVWQRGTYDQGWVGWFLQQAILTKQNPTHRFTISGDGKQVRDVLFSDDLAQCYFKAIAAADRVAGHAFNVGGGIQNSLSLLELFELLNEELQITLNFDRIPWRKSDQKFFVADNRKATTAFNWKPTVNAPVGVRRSLQWLQSER